jgi:oligopeptide/dipeptide ABC transporter ATP-binding protein
MAGADAATDSTAHTPTLAVEGLSVEYLIGGSAVRAVDRVSFQVRAGERLAVVGESGSGKTTLGLAMMGLLPKRARMAAERLDIGGRAVDWNDERSLRRVRGRTVSMVFQDAKAALDPVRTVGYQIAEPIRSHKMVPADQVPAEVVRLLRQVEIPRPEFRAGQYPHELSGGMRQRAMIAAALSGRPAVLIADEPTSALDVTTQAAVIDLMRRLGESTGMTTLLITHDLSLVAGFADTVMVLYAGRIVEYGSVEEVYRRPRHPYTRALLASVPSIKDPRRHQLGSIPGTLPDLRSPIVGCVFEPRCERAQGREICRTEDPPMMRSDSGAVARCHFPLEQTTQPATDGTDGEQADLAAQDRARSDTATILELRDIRKTFHRSSLLRRRSAAVNAVAGVDLVVHQGESVGIVGESGSGKTTLARIVVGLEAATAGEIVIVGADENRTVRVLPRHYAQMVFQDPGDSLDPRMSLAQIVAEPLVLRDGGTWRRHRSRVLELLREVGLREDMALRRPSELSGGQRQRVAIARALSTNPRLIIADEAVASLDMSARGQILNLLARLQHEHRFAYLHISHDLSMVRHVCDRVAVMYAGRIVETAPAEELFANPQHPYTQALIAAVPVPVPGVIYASDMTAPVDVSDTTPGQGCVYRSRCRIAQPDCATRSPALVPRFGDGTPSDRPATPDAHATACLHRGAQEAAE